MNDFEIFYHDFQLNINALWSSEAACLPRVRQDPASLNSGMQCWSFVRTCCTKVSTELIRNSEAIWCFLVLLIWHQSNWTEFTDVHIERAIKVLGNSEILTRISFITQLILIFDNFFCVLTIVWMYIVIIIFILPSMRESIRRRWSFLVLKRIIFRSHYY